MNDQYGPAFAQNPVFFVRICMWIQTNEKVHAYLSPSATVLMRLYGFKFFN